MVEYLDLAQDRPHSARMYDYYLGGKDNYPADVAAAQQVLRAWPSAQLAAKSNRCFMQRVTRNLAEAGIEQFLDIGTGIPTEPNLHQIAQRVRPNAHVVYVDNDPIVLAHARALLVGAAEGRTTYLHADATKPSSILSAPELRKTVDLSRPVALSIIALLHFIEEGAHELVATLVDALAPGSYLAICQVTGDYDQSVIDQVRAIYRGSGITAQDRGFAEFARFFDGLALQEPGIVPPHRWRVDGITPPESYDARVSSYAAVARKV
ncbi:SAM-dependent methyltransferase [Nocardia callitridis]|uniref:SAM-dependent methyltransferase n=1 Tax=Nocardia callitridis TaxID=648753 RepID=A0ABP9L6E3_9NOCA